MSVICDNKECRKKDFSVQKTDSGDESLNSSFLDTQLLSEELQTRNEIIVKHIILLKRKRNELIDEFNTQREENCKLQTEIERISYKIQLITKSLSQRQTAKAMYDSTIKELEAKYIKLIESSANLLNTAEKEITELEKEIGKVSVPIKPLKSEKITNYPSVKISTILNKLPHSKLHCLKMENCNEKLDYTTGNICCIMEEDVPIKLENDNPVSEKEHKKEKIVHLGEQVNSDLEKETNLHDLENESPDTADEDSNDIPEE